MCVFQTGKIHAANAPKASWSATLAWAAALLFVSACSAPRMDIKTALGRRAIIDAVHVALNRGDCADAIDLIEPLYNSKYSSDEARFARAAAHACNANIEFFPLVSRLAEVETDGSDFFVTLTELFPSTLEDSAAESGWYASDALMAILKKGAVIGSANMLNPDTYNVGSLLGKDRDVNANMYLALTSMATMGALQNRYSAPDPTTFKKTQVLGYTVAATAGWADPVNLTEEGCAYGSSMLNMLDAIEQVASDLEGQAIGVTLGNLATAFDAAIDAACESGCNGTFPTGCGFAPGSCSTCPTALRDRGSCEATTTDINSCAAAGIAHFVNTDATVGWQGP